MDGGDGGDEGEGEAEEGVEGSGAEQRNGVVAGLVPHVAGLDPGRGQTGKGFEVEDSGSKRVGGEREREGEKGERERCEAEDVAE